jgi:hypothetical protein
VACCALKRCIVGTPLFDYNSAAGSADRCLWVYNCREWGSNDLTLSSRTGSRCSARRMLSFAFELYKSSLIEDMSISLRSFSTCSDGLLTFFGV